MCRHIIYLIVLCIPARWTSAQVITSTSAGGDWSSGTTWVGGVVPTSANSTHIIVVGPIDITPEGFAIGSPLVIDEMEISTGILQVLPGAELMIRNGVGTDLTFSGSGSLLVSGRLTASNNITMTANTPQNMVFQDNSTYVHQYSSASSPLPTAHYSATSTVFITNFTTGTMDLSWSVPLGNVIYNCPGQGSGAVNFAGSLTTIRGDLLIQNTGTSGIVYGNMNGISSIASGSGISIGGKFEVTGISKFYLTTSGDVEMYVAGSFTFGPDSSATPSQSATTGSGTVIVNGDSNFTSGSWNLSSGNNGTGIFDLVGNLDTSGANLIETGGGTSQGIFNFTGATSQVINVSGISASSLQVTFDNPAGFSMSGNLVVSNSISLNNGIVYIENGSLTIDGPLIQLNGSLAANENGSILIGGYGAVPAVLQIIENSAFNVFEFNRAGSTLETTANFSITSLHLYAGTIQNNGILTIDSGGLIAVKASSISSVGIIVNPVAADDSYDLYYTNSVPLSQGPEFPANSSSIRHVTKSGTGILTLNRDVAVYGDLTVAAGTLSDGGAPLTISLAGDFESDGSCSLGASSFSFFGGQAPSQFGGSGSSTFGSLTFLHDVSISSNFQVNGNIAIADGVAVVASAGVATFGGSTSVLKHGALGLFNVVIAGGSTLVAPDTLSIAGNFTVTNTSSVFSHNNGIMIFNGSTSLQGTGAKNFNSITIAENGSLAGSQSLSLTGDLTNNGSINFTGGTLTLAGAHEEIGGTASSTFFSALTIDPGANVTVNVPFTTSGPLTINDSLKCAAGFSANAAISISSAGNLLINQGAVIAAGTVTISEPGTLVATAGPDVTFASNISASGVLSIAGKTSFTNNTTLTGAGLKMFNNIVVSGVLTPNAVYSITGDLILTQGGVLNAGANTAIFGGADSHITISGAGQASFNDLTVQAGSSLTSFAPLTINGQFSISGNFVSNDGFLSLGSVSVAVDTGSVTINSKPFSIAGTLTVSSGATMTVNNGADATLSGNISVSGSLAVLSTTFLPGLTVITGGGTKVFNALVITGTLTPESPYSVAGDLIVSGGGMLMEGTSTITFSGPNSTFSNSGTGKPTFHNLLVTAGAQLTTVTTCNINGTCRTSGNFIVDADVYVAGTMTVSRGGILSSKSNNNLIDVGGNLAISGTYASAGVTRFSGSTKMTGAGSKNFTDIVITGSLTSSNGPIHVSGNIQNDGNFIPNNGSISFDGDSVKRIFSTLTAPPAMNLYSLTLSGGLAEKDLDFEMNINLSGVLTLSTQTGVASLDVDGLSDDKVFTLVSTNDNPATDGSIAALPDNAILDGQVFIQRYLSGEGRIYRYISSPMQGVGATVATWQESFPITGLFANPSDPGIICGIEVISHNPSLFYFDESSKSYAAYPVTGSSGENGLVTGKGYAAFIRRCSDSTVITVSGPLISGINRGNVSLPVTHTDSVKTYNNLVGNPFPSAINWDNIGLTNISSTIAIRDNGTGVFQYYTQGGGGALDVANGVIAQGQAFWVRSTGINPSIIVGEQAKTPSSASSGNIFYRDLEKDVLEITLNGSTQSQIDKAYIIVAAGSSNAPALDNNDAPKMNNQRDDPYEELFDLYTSTIPAGPALAVNAVSGIQCNSPFQLSIRDVAPGSFRLNFKSSGSFDDVDIYVSDNYYRTTHSPDQNGSYNFLVTADPASQSINRFTLSFKELELNVSLPVIAAGKICGNDSLSIFLPTTQSGIDYVPLSAGRILSDTASGNGSSKKFLVPGTYLSEGINAIRIGAIGACSSHLLDTVLSIQKITPPSAQPISGNHCNAGVVNLKVVGAQSGYLYHWYENDSTRSVLFSGDLFTPLLKKSQQFYVAIVDSSSLCEGPRVPVTATITQYDNAIITVLKNDLLGSNFANGNKWYLNGELLDTTSTLKLRATGYYELKVTIAECETDDQRYIDFTGLAEANGLRVWPNPVTGLLYLEMSSSPDWSDPSLTDELGRIIGTIEMDRNGTTATGSFDLGNYGRGLYLIVLRSPGKTTSIRIVKL